MKRNILFSVLVLLLLFSCKENKKRNDQGADLNEVDAQVSVSKNGAVSTAHPLATKAGVLMLEKGGNAIDAAVAAGFVLAVVEPSMSGLGGRLQAILMNVKGEIHGVDATTQAGIDYDSKTAPKGQYGYPVIGVPGVVKGLTKLLADYGTLSLETVMAPAINYAENGFVVLKGEAIRQAMAIKEIREFKGTSKYFIKADTTYLEGDVLVQKDLANTLRKISLNGEKIFYEGEIAEKIVADVKENGGTLSMEALKAYEARDADLVSGSYRGFDLHGLYLPSFGAITIEMLHILENFDLANTDESEWGRLVFESNREAYKDRENQLEIADGKRLTSKLYAKEISLAIKEKSMASKQKDVPESYTVDGHTTHLSVADKDGNVIALTQSLGPLLGSKVATAGLGFLYATTLGGYLGDMEPGERAKSHISPLLITKQGKPYLVLGAAGGSRIVTAVGQVVSRVIDKKMPLDKALAAGRVHSGDTLILVEAHEGTWTEKNIQELKEMGYQIEKVTRPGMFGRVHAILRDTISGEWIGAADPDWEGTAASPIGPFDKE